MLAEAAPKQAQQHQLLGILTFYNAAAAAAAAAAVKSLNAGILRSLLHQSNLWLSCAS